MTPEYWNEEAAREAYGGLNDSKIAEYLSKGKMSKLLSQAEKKLASLMKKAEKLTDSLSEKCDAFNKGMSSGREAALKIIDNLLIGNLMHELGSDMGYTSQEELNEIYLSGFDEVAETEDNARLYNWGYDAGGIAALIDLIGILSALTSNAGGTQKGTTKVPVQGADGKQYVLEVPDEALMADGTLNPAIISQMQGETGDEEESETPDIKYPGDDPTASPGQGWEWRGPDQPGGEKGAWYNPETGSTLKPDLNHGEPVGPHWDYIPNKNGTQYRVYPDGTIVPK